MNGRYILLATLLFATYIMTTGGEVGAADTEKYQALMNDFKERAARLIIEAQGLKTKGMEFINGKLENAVRTNLRTKRDT